MTLRIRTARPADATALADLHATSWRASYTPYVPEAALGAALDANMQARWGTWPADRLIRVAERDGALLGFGAVEGQDPPLLDNLHVRPDVRSGGIGRNLMRAICAGLSETGAAMLHLEVIEANQDARRFYHRLGGVEEALVDRTLLGHPVRMVRVVFQGSIFRALAQEL